MALLALPIYNTLRGTARPFVRSLYLGLAGTRRKSGLSGFTQGNSEELLLSKVVAVSQSGITADWMHYQIMGRLLYCSIGLWAL
mgnify:CR=1 FL=1